MSPIDDELDHVPRRFRWLAPLLASVAIAVAIWLIVPARPIEVGDCGTIGEGVALPAHDRYCTLRGTVEGEALLTMGKGDPRATDPAQKVRGIRVFVKLAGAGVVVVLPADRADVMAWRARTHDTLDGFAIGGVGRVFDPDLEKGYGGTGQALRRLFGLPPDAALRVFDAADRPE